MRLLFLFLTTSLLTLSALAQPTSPPFSWPDGYQMALSLTFDDARPSQPNGGVDILNKYDAKATFYVVPASVKPHLEGWKRIVDAGHEIGNHSINHPCTGNFDWSKDSPLEEYSIEQMEAELMEASRQIEDLLGVTPTSYAYPCGETTIGRGHNARSVIPLIARLFQTGRGWLDETANDPTYFDRAQLRGTPMDAKDFDEILEVINQAKSQGYWLVLAGHEIGEEGSLTTRATMLEELLSYLRDSAPDIWLAPVGEIATYVEEHMK